MNAGSAVPGRTVITARALRRLTQCVVAEAAGVPVGHASVDLKDENGTLVAHATVPVSVGRSWGPLAERGGAVRERVVSDLRHLAGRTVSTVDVTFSGVHRVPRRRVR